MNLIIGVIIIYITYNTWIYALKVWNEGYRFGSIAIILLVALNVSIPLYIKFLL